MNIEQWTEPTIVRRRSDDDDDAWGGWNASTAEHANDAPPSPARHDRSGALAVHSRSAGLLTGRFRHIRNGDAKWRRW